MIFFVRLVRQQIAPKDGGYFFLRMHVLNSVMHLGLFGIIEPVQSANKIASDTSNSLELNALANNAINSV